MALRSETWPETDGAEEEEKNGDDWEYRCVTQGFKKEVEKCQEGRTESL